MSQKRVGLARTQALMESLKRELAMGGTIFSNAERQGPESEEGGPGAQSGSVGPPMTRTIKLNDQIITTITLDLQNLSGSGEYGFVIGNEDGGIDNSDPAFLLEYNTDTHGILYQTEMSCIETPAGNDLDAFDLIACTEGTFTQGDDARGAGGAVVVNTASVDAVTYAVGDTVIDQAVGSPANGQFLYLTAGVPGTAGPKANYTAGKLVIRLYGHADFGD